MRTSRALVALVVISLVLGACSSAATTAPTAEPTAAASAEPTTAPTTEASAAPTAEPTVAAKKIIFVTALLADANWQAVNSCYIERGKALGWDVSMVAPANETASNPDMVSLTEQAVNQKPDGIVIVPLVPAAFDDVLTKAKAAGIAVLALANDTPSPDQSIALVWTDWAEYGVEYADLVGQLANGVGNVGITYSGPQVTNQVTTIKAFVQRLAEKYPEMKVVNPEGTIVSPAGDRNQQNMAERTRGLLVAHPEINVLFTPDGQGGIGAVLAVKELNKKPGEIIVVGSDHLPQYKEYIETGWMAASLQAVSCNWGNAIIDTFDEYFKGTLSDRVIAVKSVLFDKANP